MRLLKLAFPFLGLALFGACGSDSDGSGNCTDYSGTWSISGDCPNVTECEVEQNGCRVTFNCNDDSELTGRVSGDEINFSNEDVECSIDVGSVRAGEQPEGSGSCEIRGGGSCEFSAECESGECLEAGNGGTGGSGGSGGRGGTGGRGGSGGSGGTPPSDCEVGAAAICACLEGTEEECAAGNAEALALACEDGEPDTEWIACFADYVNQTCEDAVEACIDTAQ